MSAIDATNSPQREEARSNIQWKVDEMNYKTKSGHVIDREFISPI